MVSSILNPFSKIFNAVSGEKSSSTSMPVLWASDVRTVKFLLNADWLLQTSQAPAVCKVIVRVQDIQDGESKMRAVWIA